MGGIVRDLAGDSSRLLGENLSIIGTTKGTQRFWQSSTNWRGRRTFDVIGKRDPLLKQAGSPGLVEQMLHR